MANFTQTFEIMLKAIINAKLNKDFDKIVIARINKMAEERTAVATNPDTHFCIYLQATNLNGFNYLEFTLISPVEIKTMGGCTLTFKTDDSEYVLKSEGEVIESDYSHNSKIGVTLVDTDLEDDFDAFIKTNVVKEIKVECKVGQVFKKDVSMIYTEINKKAFIASLVPKAAESTGEISNPGAGGGSGLGI